MRACLFNSFNFDFDRLERSRGTTRAWCTGSTRPIAVYRGFDDGTDDRIAAINRLAYATVRQSHATASRSTARSGIELVDPHVIHNARRPTVFNRRREPFTGDRIARDLGVVVDNAHKGGPTYAAFDEQLDRARYEFTFVGQSPIVLPHARMIPPVPPSELAELLREPDVFLTASRDESCSNALLEALACGLPALTSQRRHPEARRGGRASLRRRRGAAGAARPPRRRARRTALGHLDPLAGGRHRRVPRGTRSRGVRAAKGLARVRRVALAGAPRRLMLVADSADWVIAYEMRHLAETPRGSRHSSCEPALPQRDGGPGRVLRQPVRPAEPRRVLPPHMVATAYFHGRPGTEGSPEFDECYAALQRMHDGIARVQVTHREMHEVVVSAGVDPSNVHTIRIGVDVDAFRLRTPEERDAARSALGISPGAFVVGSFQKDGVGWGEGLEPKLIKGPDLLVEALDLVHEAIPELFVALSGPSRGYVRAALERTGVPYVHRYVGRHDDLRALYVASDVVAVSSRQEGGPKAVLEAMAVGVPIVSTRVGQAQELIDGANGCLVEVEDVEALADALADERLPGLVGAARETALANDKRAQEPLWRAFFDGFVTHA